MGAIVKAVLSLANTSLAVWFHFSHLGPFFRRAVRRVVMKLKDCKNRL